MDNGGILIVLDDGKYKYIYEKGKQRVLRYGEEWRDLTGDNFVYCLAERATLLEKENAKLRTLLLNLADAADGVGIKHFDTDSLSDEVEEMRLATLAARGELKKPAQL